MLTSQLLYLIHDERREAAGARGRSRLETERIWHLELLEEMELVVLLVSC